MATAVIVMEPGVSARAMIALNCGCFFIDVVEEPCDHH